MAEKDLKVLTGIEVGHSTHHRQVKKVDLSMPNVKQKLTEVCLDGGMVRLRSEKRGESAYWKEYKTGRLQGIYYGAFFQDNLSLTAWETVMMEFGSYIKILLIHNVGMKFSTGII